MKKTYWQVGCGDPGGRNYSKYFLRHGVMFIGPGELGPWPENAQAYREHCEKWGKRAVGDVARFCEEVRVGDIAILRRGVSNVLAAGPVTERDGEGYQWHGDGWLSDFDGWNLGHMRFVDWRVPATAPMLHTKGLKQGTFDRCRQQAPKEVADELLKKGKPVEPEPFPAHKIAEVELEAIFDELMDYGLRAVDAEALGRTVFQIRRLAAWYNRWSRRRPHTSEHEIRSFLVLPLLIALGWSEQVLRVEYPVRGGRKADIAGFRHPCTLSQRDDDACVMIIETKAWGSGLDFAYTQAVESYLPHFRRCTYVVITNGTCYRVYEVTPEKGNAKPCFAYLNVHTLADKFPPEPEVPGALEALRMLMPG